MFNFLVPLVLPVVSRWHGRETSISKPFKSIAYALPYALSVITQPLHALIALAIGALGKSVGHESFFRMAIGGKALRSNWLADLLIRYGFTRDTLAFSVAGLATKGFLISVATLNVILILTSVIGIPLGYYIGRHYLNGTIKCPENKYLEEWLLQPNFKSRYIEGITVGEILGAFFASLGFLFI